jgi:CDP-6-deoxy-D-xylo-4-hexulose-3-dehydrase
MKVLIIGASGLVGGALARVLERGNVPVTAAYHSRSIPNGVRVDVRDAASVQAAFDAAKPDVVVWSVVAPGGVDGCETEPDEARALEVDGLRRVLECARRAGARVVYVSSDYVFDGAAGPYAEDAAPRPISAYGRAKADAETLALREPGALVIRTTAVFGWDRASKNFAMSVWNRLSAGETLRAPSDQWCNPTLADALAETTLRLVQDGATGVVNVAGADRMTRAELGQALARAMALDPALVVPTPTAHLAQKAPRPLQGGLVMTRLESRLGTAPLGLGEALKRFRRAWRADTHQAIAPRAASDEAARLKREILEAVRRYHAVAHAREPWAPFKGRVNYSGRVFGAEELTNLVDASLDFWLTLGPWGDLFESRMRDWMGARDFVSVNSGSTANLAAVMTLTAAETERPLRPGDEVITPAVTFPTTLAPIVHAGLVPVFVDCEVGTYNVDPALLAGAISPKTRAIMVPHTLGVPCDLDVIMELARRHGLYVVEDCCDALGATWRGRKVGTFGDLATVSFFPAHQMTTGEGGGVFVNTVRLARVARSVRDWGRDCWCAPGEANTCGKRFGWQLGELPRGYDHKYIYSNLGYNFKPTDLQAAIGVAQLERLPGFVAARRRNFDRLYAALEPYQDRLILPTRDPRSEPSWFGFTLTVREGVSKAALVAWLETANIETRQVFAGNILRQPGYRGIAHRVHGTLERSDRVMRDTFFVGVYPGLTDEMLDFVAARIGDFFRR